MSYPPPDYEKDNPQSPPHVERGPPSAYGQMAPYQPYGPNQLAPQQQYGHHPPQMMHQQHTTTVVVNQPTVVQNDRILGPRDGHRDWSSGLFSCFDDVGKCMYTLFCPSCVLAEISAKLGECACVTCCIPGGIATIRTRVRTLGGIKGSICKDYMVTECCQPCAMCQIQRELEYMGL